MKAHLFVFGLGYVGQAFAYHFKEKRGGQISGTTRSPEKASSLKQEGLAVFTSFEDPEVRSLLSTATHVLYTIPPFEKGASAFLSFLSDSFLPNIEWIGYISSTSVYGDHKGEKVDEETKPTPNTAEGKARLDIEKALLLLSPTLPIHIFRCAGIYGPGRNVLRNILNGKAQRIDHPGVVFSRIYLADIMRILEASIHRPNAGQIYNMADDNPASTADVVAYGCALLNKPLLPLLSLEEAHLSKMGRAFYQSAKTVLNHKIKKELEVKLQFSSYQQGLDSLLETELGLKKED